MQMLGHVYKKVKLFLKH